MRLNPILTAVLLSAVFCDPVAAGDMPVPIKLQVEIFGKVFDYVKTLPAGDRKVLVLYTNETAGIQGDLVQAFQETGVTAAAIHPDQLGTQLTGATAVYISPGVPSTSASQLCRERGVLSISGLPSLAKTGEVSIGVGMKSGRPEIIVNLGQVRAQGHEVSSDLLRLATVVQ